MCDSVAYSISRATLNQLYHSSIGLANLGLRLMDHQLLLQENWLINSGSPRAKERYLTLIKETPELLQYVTFKVHCILSVDNTAVAEQEFGHPYNLTFL